MQEFLSSEFWLYAANKLLRIVAISIGAMTVLRFFGPVIDRFFQAQTGSKKFYLEEKRARTLSSLFKSVIRYTVYFITLVLVLQEFKIDTTSLIAGAGIVGLAIGVGAQSLVKDVITGFFVILEDQYSVGDYIVIDSMAGHVEDIGFRVTVLRDANGVRHIIPNGAIGKVSNYTRGHMQAVINIPVAYEADIGKVLQILEEICAGAADMPEVLERPKVIGVVDFRTAEIIVRIAAKTVPLEQVKVETAIRRRIKERFDAEHIPPPAAFVRPGA
ncbi:MAG: mechanosensitive ion channel family protein [Negativicutes bacterium]|nr:mechanosensitive ion channel family protein [Negativicutes bacterium]